jgi:hypothetical protein
VIGSTYNVGSTDEVSNLHLCSMLLSLFGHDTTSPGFKLADHVQHTVDRPFNDRRYAVDATRLRELGWRQRVAFEDGLRSTVEWYRKFGERWWGDVGKVVGEAFPTVRAGEVVNDKVGGDEPGMKRNAAMNGNVNVDGKKTHIKHGTLKKQRAEKRNGTEPKKAIPEEKRPGKKSTERKHAVKSDIDRSGTNDAWEKRNSVSINGTRVQV